MSESSAMNSDDKLKDVAPKRECIKTEVEVPVVKPEPHECVVCASLSLETYDIYSSRTAASGTLLHNFLTKFTNVEFSYTQNVSKYICKNCFDLVNVLEQAEIEYVKLKETFEAIISKNPLFESHCLQPIRLDTVKNESINQYNTRCNTSSNVHNDSEDEPLAITKKKRHHKVQKRKKKGTSSISKRKVRNKQNVHSKPEIDDRWECNECGDIGTGGAIAEAAHQLSEHNPILRDIKKEDSNDGQYSNGFDENLLKMELMNHDDDDSSNYIPDDEPSLDEMPPKRKVTLITRRRAGGQKKKEKKALHRCDKCDAKYTSLARLEQHQAKHDGSKPPYICEVCGAHYKHKRACDIHVAMHKGISDWKCEECNKLFPSKGALQRHNNIHTGKLNYQCDLCGKSFIHTSSFKMHKLSHSGLKPHSCDVCGLALMTRSHLKRHKRVHSGEKRHECTVCGKRFSERYNLMAHSKSHETPAGVAGAAGAAAGAGEAAAGVAPRRRLFRCPFCAERFERRYMLERHAAAAHGRALERPPPTPRNTMSKLLKAQAARHPPAPPDTPDTDSKDARSPDSRSTPIPTSKLMAHLSAAGAGGGSWSGAYAEFNLRTDYH